VARLADNDAWRQQLRDPELRKDRAALERLAAADGVMDQPPGNLTLLSRALLEANAQAVGVRLLRRAQARHPADFWINLELANMLYGDPATRTEALGFIRVAVALRPRSPVLYMNLAAALGVHKKAEEAEAACRRAIREAEGAYRKAAGLEPKNAKFAQWITKAERQ
jgi:hypothetical protein